MRENRDFVVPVNILTTFAHAPFSWAARHTTVCLDSIVQFTFFIGKSKEFSILHFQKLYLMQSNSLLAIN